MSIAKAKALQAKGDHAGAISLIQHEIAEQPLRQRLRLAPVDMFDLLEARVFSLVKLRKWNSAKADADAMIKLRPKDPRGFLRKGHIYFENGHFGRAARTYRHALFCTEKSSQMHAKLEKQYEKLKAMAHTAFADPVKKFPPELLYTIFGETISEPRDLVRLMLVSRSWLAYISSEPKFWSNLVFSGSEYISHQTLDRFMAKSGDRGLHLTVSRLVRKSPGIAKMLAKYSNLETLHFETSVTLDEIVELRPRFDRLVSLKMAASRLEQVLCWSLENLPALESIELIQSGTILALDPRECKVACPLRHLAVVGNSNTQPCIRSALAESICDQSSLLSLVFHRALSNISPVLPRLGSPLGQLEKFGFTACRPRATDSPIDVPLSSPLRHLALNKLSIQWSRPQEPLPLEYLEIKWSQFAPEWGISTLLRYLGCSETLESLILERNSLQHGLESGQDVEIYPKLRNLYLVAMPIPVSTRFIEWICASMPVLEFVNFNETPIDGRGVVKLVRHGVKHIRCRSGSIDPETLVWAQERGSRVVTR